MNKQEQTKYLQDYNSNANSRNATTYLTKETFNKLADFYKKNNMDIIKVFEGDDIELI